MSKPKPQAAGRISGRPTGTRLLSSRHRTRSVTTLRGNSYAKKLDRCVSAVVAVCLCTAREYVICAAVQLRAQRRDPRSSCS